MDLTEEAIGYAIDGADPEGRRWLEDVVGLPSADRPAFAGFAGLMSCYRRFLVGVARVEFAPDGFAALSWQPVDQPEGLRAGAMAITVPVTAGGVVVDILALHPVLAELWASRRGDPPDCLGADAALWPAQHPGVAVRLCATPLDWLRERLAAHLAWQAAVRAGWAAMVRGAGRDGWPSGWGGLPRARRWLRAAEWSLDPACPREPGPEDSACLLRPERAEAVLTGLPGLTCDSAGHAADLRALLAAQRRARRAAEPGLPACEAIGADAIRGAA